MIDHNYTITEIEDMLPWELMVHVSLLETKLKEREEAAKRGKGA
jgi:hypothetical protein